MCMSGYPCEGPAIFHRSCSESYDEMIFRGRIVVCSSHAGICAGRMCSATTTLASMPTCSSPTRRPWRSWSSRTGMHHRHTGHCGTGNPNPSGIFYIARSIPWGCLLALKWQSHRNIIAGWIRKKKSLVVLKIGPHWLPVFLVFCMEAAVYCTVRSIPAEAASQRQKNLFLSYSLLNRATLNRGLSGTLSLLFPQAFVGCRAHSWRKPVPRYLKTAWEFSGVLGWGCFVYVCVCGIRYRRENKSQQQKM